MFGVWSTLSSCLLVLAILFAEYMCDDTFIGAALKVGDSLSNQSSSRENWTLNNQQWPVVGERRAQVSNNFGRPNSNTNENGHGTSYVQSQIRTFNNADSSRSGIQEWPAVGERRQATHLNNNQGNHYNNPNNNQHLQSLGNRSFVHSQVDQWNSRLSPNNSYAASVNNRGQSDNVRPQQTNFRTTDIPFTGIHFGGENDRVNGQEQSIDSRANTNQVSDNELREFSESLLLKDENNAARYVRVNFQGRTTSRSRNDEAPLPLLSINREAYNIPTINKLQPLYDNYIVRSNVDEDHTNQKKQEENTLLKAILQTNVMKATRNFLIEKGAISNNERDFENLLYDMWFHLYSREKRKVGSSGFEHVFLAEIKRGDVSGLHNWLYFEREEASHKANYLGYLKKIDLGGKGAILKFNFDFDGINKPVGSMFIGTSPEFEMALYSICFILRADRVCPLKLNGSRFVIRTYTFKYDGKNLIGSAFPEI